MTKIKIESGIPIPKRGRKSGSKYPFVKLEVGDSFAVPNGKEDSVRHAIWHHGKALTGRKFVIRKVEDGTYRCWRTE